VGGRRLSAAPGLALEGQMMDTLSVALDYLRRGWSIIPIKTGTKKPSLKTWKQYQSTRPTEAQVRKWFVKGQHGIGIICGAVSGSLTVIDFDEAELYQRWKADHPDLAAALPTVQTGRGFHVYAVTDETKTLTLDGIDIKASGYVVAPPSVHTSGTIYRWTTPPNGQQLPKIDLESLNLPQDATRHHYDTTKTPQRLHRTPHNRLGVVVGGGDGGVVAAAIRETLPTEPGQRNNRLFLLAARLKAIYNTPEEARPAVEKWHKAAQPIIRTKDFEPTWFDFVAAWGRVKFPSGSGVLGQAVMTARQRIDEGRGIKQADFESDSIKLLLEVLFELALQSPDGTFFMSSRKAGSIIGYSRETARNILSVFCDRGYIEKVQTDRNQREAQTYKWTAADDEEIPF